MSSNETSFIHIIENLSDILTGCFHLVIAPLLLWDSNTSIKTTASFSYCSIWIFTQEQLDSMLVIFFTVVSVASLLQQPF